jgi:sugar phosphate isomerase/epimerase
MMKLLGLDNQTMFGLSPIDHIRLAAELGCGSVSLAHAPVPWKLEQFDKWSLLDDTMLLADTKAALRDTGVRVALAEGFIVRCGSEARDKVAEMDLMAELGAERIGVVSMEKDTARALDQMATLAELAGARNMLMAFEYAPPHTFNTLEKAKQAIRSLSMPNTRLLIDSMHFFRTGGTLGELVDLEPGLVGYIQLSDAPLKGNGGDYYLEASFERLLPGQGELPLIDFLSVLPSDVPIGLEVPRQSALKKDGNYEREIGRIVAAAKSIVEAASRHVTRHH